MMQLFWKTIWQFLIKLSIYLPQVLGIYPTEMKTHIHQNTCARLFIATLIKNKSKLKRTQISMNRSKCVWINKLCYIHTVQDCGKRTIFTYNDMEGSQQHCWVTYFQKSTGCMVTFIGVLLKTKNKLMVRNQITLRGRVLAQVSSLSEWIEPYICEWVSFSIWKLYLIYKKMKNKKETM